jgi:hypothetical protein
MALFIPGTKCPLCNREIASGEARRLFPAFVRNSRDPLHVFHDATVHEQCLSRDARLPVLEAVMTLRAKSRAEKSCVVCHRTIAGLSDYYSTEYITADSTHELFAYNYLTFHRSHLAEWEKWGKFRELTSLLLASDAWSGAGILPID